jgi:signal peptidase I
MENSTNRRRWRRALWLLVPLLGVSLWYGSSSVAYVANIRLYTIPTASMAPTLAPGDRISVDQRGGTPERGEIWVFSMPNGSTLVKRVIGLPGETIEVTGGRVVVDGKALAEPYLAAPITYAMPPVRLGADEYFMLGDRRNGSNDSHVWGPLPKDRLIGRVEYRYWPRNRIGGIK